MSGEEYIIRGGLKGRERLRVLWRVLQPTTLQLFNRAGVKPGMTCLDLGCGGGDVCFDLAEIADTDGKVTGIDLDTAKIEIARQEALERKLLNVEFNADDMFSFEAQREVDIVYTRFLLTHLKDPDSALKRM